MFLAEKWINLATYFEREGDNIPLRDFLHHALELKKRMQQYQSQSDVMAKINMSSLLTFETNSNSILKLFDDPTEPHAAPRYVCPSPRI